MRTGTRARRATRRGAVAFGGLLLLLALAAVPAQASRVLVSGALLQANPGPPPIPPPEAEIEGACGLAVSPGGSLYVSDYYHRAVDVFSSAGGYQSQILLPGANPIFGINTLDAVCGLAFDSAGTLYANEWHENVQRLSPSAFTVDSEESTGVAVDAAGNVYVDDRTYVAEYAAPVDPGDLPALKIGLDTGADYFGVAVSGGRVYVPDAASDTVKVYEPAGNPAVAVKTIGGFVSLTDASLAVDPSNEHLLVVDNVQPGFEHPKSAVKEFDSSGAFLGQLPGAPINGEPSGIAVASDGTLYVTSGNDEGANVFEYSPYSASFAALSGGPGVSAAATGPASTDEGRQPAAGPSPGFHSRPARHPLRSQTELVQKGPIRVAVSGGLAPTRLPRTGAAPINITIGGQISSTDPDTPPQLRTVSFAFNRAGRLDTRGLPRCGLGDIDPSTTAQALEACRSALVGEGQFSAAVRLPEQSPFPSAGKVLAFNGILHGHPVIFAHIYGDKPVPTSVVLPLEIHQGKGRFSTRLDASLASLTGDWGYVTGISLRLGRKFKAHGERRSFLSAGCPAPKGFPGALFPLAKASFSFVGGRTLTATLTRNCTVRG
jgi:DNA-binding beta-propeller fold protein YncE